MADLETDSLRIVGSCPIYDPDSGAGNNPGSPSNPQDHVFLFRRNTSVSCQIFVRNKTAAPISNIDLVMTFPTSSWEVVSPFVLPDGDLWYHLMWSESVHVTTKALQGGTSWSGAPTIPSGYPAGTWDLSTFQYRWEIASLDAEGTREFRVTLRPNYHKEMDTPYQIEVVATHDGQAARQYIPARYDFYSVNSGLTPSSAVPLRMLPEDRLLGVHNLGTGSVSSHYRRNPNTVVFARLPYYNAANDTFNADGLFDPTNVNHIPAVDPASISGSLSFGSSGSFDLLAGRLTGPSAGFNADRVIVYNDQTNSVDLFLGGQPQHTCCPASTLRFVWNGKPTMPLAIGDRLPFQTCYHSDITGGLVCSIARWIDVSDEPLPPTFYLSSSGNLETSALRPTASFYPWAYFGNDGSTQFGATDLYFQLPGDSEKRTDFGHFYFNWDTIEGTIFEIYVSTHPGSYGSEDNLEARVVPSTPEAEWVRCNRETSNWCQHSDLTRVGINPADVTEIRVHLPYLDPGIIARGMTGNLGVQWRVDLHRSARGSIDGSTFDRNNMTRSSIGMKSVLRYTEGTAVKDVVSTYNWELNRASVTNTFRACHDAANQEVAVGDTISFWLTSSCTSLETGFRNTGGLENVTGPFDIVTTLPEGFEYDNSAIYPLEPYRPRVRQVRYGGTSEDWTGFMDYGFDPVTRELYITLQPDNVENALFPSTRTWANGEIVGFSVELQGQVLFGAPRDLKTSNTSMNLTFEDPMGVRYATSLGPDPALEAHYLVGLTSSLSLTGTVSQAEVSPGQEYRHIFTISNPAFQDDGQLLENGATGDARRVALYKRITKAGDYPLMENGGIAQELFDVASSSDAVGIYISSWETPVLDHSGVALTEANGWQLCAPDGAYCGPAEAAALLGSTANVRWVAFDFGDVLITDAEPRGVAPIDGATRVNHTYRADMQLYEDGSTGGATIRSVARLYSQDDLPRVTPIAALDVLVDSLCGLITCEIGQSCIEESCLDACETDLDCGAPEICVIGGCTTDLCLGVDCGPGGICHGGSCFPECLTSEECGVDEQCYDGRCTATPCEGVYCVEGQFCFSGGCADPCLSDAECFDGQTCLSGRCADDPCDGISCESGSTCHQGGCFPICETRADCSSAEDCFAGTCRVASCDVWSECEYLDSCGTTGERTRHCEEYVCDEMGYCLDYEFFDSESCSREAGCPTALCSPACPGNQICWGGTCFPSGCNQGNLCDGGKCVGFPYDDTYNRCVDEPIDMCADVVCDDICHEGGCFDGCTRNSDCPGPGQKCFEGRCATSQCDFIQCEVGLICRGGKCKAECTANSDCAAGSKCYAGACKTDPCDGYECGEDESCHGETCFADCTLDAHCPDDGEVCIAGRCTLSACHDVTCALGEVCYEGGCFVDCSDGVIVCDPDHACYDGRCAIDACDGVQCQLGWSCYEGTCFPECTEDEQCDENHYCYDGRCSTNACAGVQCAPGSACYEGSCFGTCIDDDQCVEVDHFCYDGRCAIDACFGVQCQLGWSCYEGTCFPECTDDLQCDEDHYCYDGRCASDACTGVQCAIGSECYEGTCFGTCIDDDQCFEVDHFCFDGRCATGACEGVQCALNAICYEGSCFQICTADDECNEENFLCYEGRCAEEACDGVQCQSPLMCYGGSCFQTCTVDDECDEENAICFNGRCATDVCEGVQCGSESICFWGTCFPDCNSTSCDPGDACYSGRCTDDPCEAVACGAEQICYQGSCFQSCTKDEECDEDNHYCYSGRCASAACVDVDCPVGMQCYLGSCFVGCTENDDCTLADEYCFNERCAPDPCHGITCREGQECIQGTCFAPCGEDGACDPDHHCYQGYCHQDLCDGPDTIKCHPGQVCHRGTCFYECSDDDQCDAENQFCYDGRCATDSCAGLVDGYDDEDHPHLYRELGGYWPSLTQRSLPIRRPRPLVHTGAISTLVNGLTAAKRARVVLYLDEDRKNYGVALFHGRIGGGQGAAGATYSVRYWGLAEEPRVSHSVGSELSWVLNDDDDFQHHQIQMQSAGGTEGLAGVVLGLFPVDEPWTVAVSAALRGDLEAWEVYSAETDEWLEIDPRETMELVNVPIPEGVRLSAEVGVRECLPTQAGVALEGICSRGTVDTCRYGYLECAQTVPRWSFEACDGRDTTCDGRVDETDEDEGVLVPMVYVRQDGTLNEWTRWATIDRESNAFEFLNYAQHQTRYGDGSAAVMGVNPMGDLYPIQAGNRALLFFHRDTDTGIITMPMIHGARVNGSFPSSVEVGHQIEFDYDATSPNYDYSDLMFASWYDDWMPMTSGGAPDEGSYGDGVPETMKADEIKLNWEVRRIDVDGTPGREADTAMMQFLWHTPQTRRPLHFVIDPNLSSSSLGDWRIYQPYAALRYLDPGKKFEVKVAWAPIEESMCTSDTAVDGCRGNPYVCIDGQLSCPVPTADTCTGCRDRDGDGYMGYDAVLCPEGNDCNDDPLDPRAPFVNPGATETCDGRDTNCDGYVDAIGPAALSESCPGGAELCGPAECHHRLICSCRGDDCECSIALEDDAEYTSGQRASWLPGDGL